MKLFLLSNNRAVLTKGRNLNRVCVIADGRDCKVNGTLAIGRLSVQITDGIGNLPNISCGTVPACFCGFNHDADVYNDEFWVKDLYQLFLRIEILMKYACLPYIMRHENYNNSKFKGMYITIARWCNQPNFYKKKSFREFCVANGINSGAYRYMTEFEKLCPWFQRFFDMKFENERKFTGGV